MARKITTPLSSAHLRLILLCFFLSGVAGLVYEVVWARRLALFLGITTWANTAVIASFMGGLALGAWWFGRLADRRRDTLRLYGWIEASVGLYALLTPWIFSSLQALYSNLAGTFGLVGTTSHLLRLSMALAALLVPTFLMGGTLPLLLRAVGTGMGSLGSDTGRLYGLNTLGATVGTFSAGFLLLPSLGMGRTLLVAAGINFAVAAIALSLRGGEAPQKTKAKKPEPESVQSLQPIHRIVLIGFAISGFAALIYEMAWIRALTLVVGASVYAFSTTLTTFLAGMALGSLAFGWFAGTGKARNASLRDRVSVAALLEVMIGLTALVGLSLIGKLPALFLEGVKLGLHEGFISFQFLVFGLCALVMLPTTLLLGALFPLVISIWVRNSDTIASGVGVAYAVNTLGTICGALLGGLVLLPTLGVQKSLLAGAVLHVLIGVAFWLAAGVEGRAASRLWKPAVALGMLVALAAVLPPWDPDLMMAGVFYRPKTTLKAAAGKSLKSAVHETRLLFYEEGIDASVAVKSDGSEKILVINGKTDASSHGDLPTQVLIAQIPMLLHPEPRDVLVIGLGSGITAGSVATHASMTSTTVAEISPEVVRASQFFSEYHGNVLEDDRVELVVADARNYLLAESRTWDVIISEPSNPWITGISNLFTKEAFQLERSRLNPGGLLVQWVQIYNLTRIDLQTVIRTFLSVFPEVSLWMPSPGDLILVGSDHEHSLSFARLEAAFESRAIRKDLQRIGADSSGGVVRTFLMAKGDLEVFSAGAPINTDDRPRIEFNAPRSLYQDTDVQNMQDLTRRQDGSLSQAPVQHMAQPVPGGLDVPALGLRLAIDGGVADGNWQTRWIVTWKVISAAGAEVPEASVTDQRLVAWLEGGEERRVQTVVVSVEPGEQEQIDILRRNLGGEVTSGGRLTLPCNKPGVWGVGPPAADGRRRIAIAWAGEASGDKVRYLARREIVDTSEIDIEATVADFGSQFLCL